MMDFQWVSTHIQSLAGLCVALGTLIGGTMMLYRKGKQAVKTAIVDVIEEKFSGKEDLQRLENGVSILAVSVQDLVCQVSTRVDQIEATHADFKRNRTSRGDSDG